MESLSGRQFFTDIIHNVFGNVREAISGIRGHKKSMLETFTINDMRITLILEFIVPMIIRQL